MPEMRQAGVDSRRGGFVRRGSLPFVQRGVRPERGFGAGPARLIPVVCRMRQPSAAVPASGGGDDASREGEPQQDSEGENEAAAVAERFPPCRSPLGRRRKPKSALQTLIEVVAGGLAGCLVAYYGLAFYYGPEFRRQRFAATPVAGHRVDHGPAAAPDDAKAEAAGEKTGQRQAQGRRIMGNRTTRSSCSPGQNVIQLG